jgi:hypothetical protein
MRGPATVGTLLMIAVYVVGGVALIALGERNSGGQGKSIFLSSAAYF